MSKVNVEAKKERHKKLFEGQYHTLPGQLWFYSKRTLKKAFEVLTPSRRRISQFMHPLDHLPAPRRMYAQVMFFSFGFLLLNSINVSTAYTGGEGVEEEYLALEEDAYITDESGYIIKNMPLEGEATFDHNRTERVDYVVQTGDTLSMIAYRFGLNVSSVRYANPTLGNSDYLKVGQSLSIPPKDGIYVEVKDGSTLVALMDKYKGNLDETKGFNELGSDADLVSGEEIFIVGGRPEIPTYIASGSSGASGYSSAFPTVMQFDIVPSAEGWIRPTSGILTQKYRPGHYAYDIADRSRPLVLATASGVVEYVSYSGYDEGYGINAWINHGNGYRTHYAHLEKLFINNGDTVSQGFAIGKMGNTGMVWGVTGIHLHFELEYNGIKINPSVMGVW